MCREKLVRKTGFVRQQRGHFILDGDDGLPWSLDCNPSMLRHIDQRITLTGFAYSVHRLREGLGVGARVCAPEDSISLTASKSWP